MIENICNIAHEAGEVILKHYQKAGEVDHKDDDSPLTQADKDAHEVIKQRLEEGYPYIPILSEEGKETPYSEREDWDKFWLVDPLDGTKEFIKGSGEFTVNIALVRGNQPVLGVIACPGKGFCYYAEIGKGAFYTESTPEKGEPIEVGAPDTDQPRIVASRDHKGPKVQQLVDHYPNAQLTNSGSSLKFCLVAHGKADVYLRDVPTMEWDTGAAQVIVEEAGGQVLTLDNKPLTYNKSSLQNPEIITTGKAPIKWEEVLTD